MMLIYHNARMYHIILGRVEWVGCVRKTGEGGGERSTKITIPLCDAARDTRTSPSTYPLLESVTLLYLFVRAKPLQEHEKHQK